MVQIKFKKPKKVANPLILKIHFILKI